MSRDGIQVPTIVCDLGVYLQDSSESGRDGVDLGALMDWCEFFRSSYDSPGTIRVESVAVTGHEWGGETLPDFAARVDVRMVLTFIESDSSAEDHCWWMDSGWNEKFYGSLDPHLPCGWWASVVIGNSTPAASKDSG